MSESYSGSTHALFVSSSVQELLLIEMVGLTKRMVLEERKHGLPGIDSSSLFLPQPVLTIDDANAAQEIDAKLAHAEDEETEKESVSTRLELLGYRVGQGLVERFSRDRPRFIDTLDIIKFICKDLWTLLFRKQIDNLKTNHRGVYVLTDHSFRWFSKMSSRNGRVEADSLAQPVRSINGKKTTNRTIVPLVSMWTDTRGFGQSWRKLHRYC